jgi:hypothetical protein
VLRDLGNDLNSYSFISKLARNFVMVNHDNSSAHVSRGAYYAWIGAVVYAIAFTVLMWFVGPRLQPFLDTLLPDQGAAWYYWKLPTRDFWAMLGVWSLYLLHQISIWAVIYRAKKNKEFRTPRIYGLSRYNIAALGINAVFIVLHLVETHLWFDGLAQDVPIWTSQYSVILMLVIVLLIETRRRGLFLGRGAPKPFTPSVTGWFRRNHMYLFAWALVYTFWFHPMATDPQLVSGFFYMFLLFTQVSLAYTRVHFTKWWIVVLESYVALHALIVAVYNTLFFESADIWPMFFLGFAFMFIMTQMYALTVSKRIQGLLTGVYAVFTCWIYLPAPFGLGRAISNLLRLEFLWIPIILYGLAAVFAGIIYVYMNARAHRRVELRDTA